MSGLVSSQCHSSYLETTAGNEPTLSGLTDTSFWANRIGASAPAIRISIVSEVITAMSGI